MKTFTINKLEEDSLRDWMGKRVHLISEYGASSGTIFYGFKHPVSHDIEILNPDEDYSNSTVVGRKPEFCFLSERHPGLVLELSRVKKKKGEMVSATVYDVDISDPQNYRVLIGREKSPRYSEQDLNRMVNFLNKQ
jgi:hypothetical protein